MRSHVFVCAQLEVVKTVQSGSRQYAQRQIKWARGLPLFQWLDAQQPTAAITAQIVDSLQQPPFTGAAHRSSVAKVPQKQELVGSPGFFY